VEFSKKGIYLRESYLTDKPQDFIVTVKPTFREESEKTIKIEFERKIALISDASYIEHTDFLFFTNFSSPFQVRVDPSRLEKGKVHVTEVVGVDNDNRELGPLFRVPITIIVPQEVTAEDNYTWKRTMHLKPAETSRFFIKSPEGATYARLKLKSQNRTTTSKIACAVMDMLPGTAYNRNMTMVHLFISWNANTL
jgi:tripeptidyl-peptidase-2